MKYISGIADIQNDSFKITDIVRIEKDVSPIQQNYLYLKHNPHMSYK